MTESLADEVTGTGDLQTLRRDNGGKHSLTKMRPGVTLLLARILVARTNVRRELQARLGSCEKTVGFSSSLSKVR